MFVQSIAADFSHAYTKKVSIIANHKPKPLFFSIDVFFTSFPVWFSFFVLFLFIFGFLLCFLHSSSWQCFNLNNFFFTRFPSLIFWLSIFNLCRGFLPLQFIDHHTTFILPFLDHLTFIWKFSSTPPAVPSSVKFAFGPCNYASGSFANNQVQRKFSLSTDFLSSRMGYIRYLTAWPTHGGLTDEFRWLIFRYIRISMRKYARILHSKTFFSIWNALSYSCVSEVNPTGQSWTL